MKYRNLFAALIMLLICVTAVAQERKEPLRINYGVKAGFQAITYNSIDFDIAGYSFNDNTIQSDKVGFFVAPFIRFTKNNFYLQTEAALGITYHNYDFYETQNATGFIPNTSEYQHKTFCAKVPLLLGYNFINYPYYGMSVYTGPRVKFILNSISEQEFSHFKYEDLYEDSKKTEWYWEFGLGIKIYNVMIDITYDWGFHRNKSNIYSPAQNLIFHSKRSYNVLSFSAGFIF